MKRYLPNVLILAFAGNCCAADLFSNQSASRHVPQLNARSVSKSGVTAPTGGFWSEVQNDVGVTTVANTVSGFSVHYATATGNFRLVDDFIVPAGASWKITNVKFFCYRTGFTSGTFLTGGDFKVWTGTPYGGGTLVYSGTSTLVETDQIPVSPTSTANIFRVFNTIVAPVEGGSPTTPGTTRKIRMVSLTLTTSVTLPPGSYWIDFQAVTPTTTNTCFAVPTIHEGVRGMASANGSQLIGTGALAATVDAGQPATLTPPVIAQDIAFMLGGKWVSKATSATVTSGEVFSGTVASVATSDNTYYQFFNDGSTLVAVAEFSGPSPTTTPISVQLVCEYHVARGGLALAVDEYDYSISDWINLAGVEATTVDSIVDVTVTSNVGHFISGGPLKARTLFSPVNDEDPSQDGWLHSVDAISWTVDE